MAHIDVDVETAPTDPARASGNHETVTFPSAERQVART